MTLGRGSTGSIKIKTDDAGGGLRAVECACCNPLPCRDCPPFFSNLNFSLSGDQVVIDEQFQYPAAICPGEDCNITGFPADIVPRVCSDSWDAYGPGYILTNLYTIALIRASGGFYGAPSGAPCCWVLSLGVFGYFEYDFMGIPDVCLVSANDQVVITNLNPAGSYSFKLYSQCVPPFMGPPNEFNFTVTIS
jgi:hypothetical protein